MITIANPSFESQVLADGSFTSGLVTGWTSPSNTGVFNPTASHFSGGNVPDGQNSAFSAGGTLAQSLSATLTANTQYTLTAMVGRRLDTAFPGYRVQLYAGSTLLAEDDSLLLPALGQFQQTTVTYLATASDPLLGQQLQIRFLSKGQQTNFDDFRLDATTVGNPEVPEPASMTLALLGGLCLGGRRLRRRVSAA